MLFKKSDDVFDVCLGWGKVVHITNSTYCVFVQFEKHLSCYTKDGKHNETDLIPRLSFTEYTLQGFSQERLTMFCQFYGRMKRIINNSIPKK